MIEDIVVIGSGFGGSICANRLALAGRKVLVLERGPWRDSLPVRSMGVARRAPFPYGLKFVTHFLRTIRLGRGDASKLLRDKKGIGQYLRYTGVGLLQALRRLGGESGWGLTLNKSGMYEVFSYPGLDVLVTSAVGGGSHAWLGLLVKPQDPAYWRQRHPELNPAQVEKYYDKVLADMGAVPLSQEHALPHSIWKHLPSPDGRCRPADPQPHLAIKYPGSPSEAGQVTEGDGGVKRRTCAFDGDSLLGSRGGAKASVDFIYLAPVLNKGATVRDMCEVTRIIRRSGAGEAEYAVHFSDLRRRKEEVIGAKRVILAAGTMNTLRLLFASSEPPNGLSPMPCLGRTFGGNGDLLGAWFKDSADPMMFKSPPVHGRFKMDGQDVPFMGMGGLPGFDTLPLPPRAKKALAKTVLMVGMGADAGDGSASFVNGRLEVDYDPERQPIFEEIREAFRTLEAQSGLKTWAIAKPFTIHPWGGTCLGPGPDRGVVDHNGEVYGNPGLFVADGSALPAAPDTPPSLVIAAWAHHVADRLAQRAS